MMWKSAVKDSSALPALGNSTDDLRVTLDDGIIYRWNGTTWAVEGSQRFIYDIPPNTDQLVEGITNLYFTTARVLDAVDNNIDGGAAATVYGGTTDIDGGNA